MTKIQDIRNRTPYSNHTRNLSQIKYIVRHHSATETGNFDSFMDYWRNSRGWGTGGYHEIILRDGTVQLCYNPEQVTNGVANMNTLCYHICLVGNGSFTDAQEKAWDERVTYNMDRLGIGVDNVKGHGELTSTSCPGIDMNTVRNRIKDDVKIYEPKAPSTPKRKSISQMADEVEAGIHGNGHSNRRKSLGISASEYEKVRAEVNRRAGIKSTPSKPQKTISQMAQEVIDGKHGNGNEARRKSLGISRSEYEKVRAEVNRHLSGGGRGRSSSKSIDQMAREVIRGEHGNGNETRRKSLGISKSEYEKVRRRVNSLL